MTDAKTMSLKIVEWEGQIHCVYLDDVRIAGGKPWGGGDVIASFKVKPADLSAVLERNQRRQSEKP
jgi:hypothetical protein